MVIVIGDQTTCVFTVIISGGYTEPVIYYVTYFCNIQMFIEYPMPLVIKNTKYKIVLKQ